MIPQRRLNILTGNDDSQPAQAAVEWYQPIPLPPKSRILVFREFPGRRIPWILVPLSMIQKVRS